MLQTPVKRHLSPKQVACHSSREQEPGTNGVLFKQLFPIAIPFPGWLFPHYAFPLIRLRHINIFNVQITNASIWGNQLPSNCQPSESPLPGMRGPESQGWKCGGFHQDAQIRGCARVHRQARVHGQARVHSPAESAQAGKGAQSGEGSGHLSLSTSGSELSYESCHY